MLLNPPLILKMLSKMSREFGTSKQYCPNGFPCKGTCISIYTKCNKNFSFSERKLADYWVSLIPIKPKLKDLLKQLMKNKFVS